MKVKKYIGEIINGFLIIDTYAVTLPSGKSTRKVLLKCQDCGREFERNSGVNFEHIKCKCKCKSIKPRKTNRHFVEWQGKKYILTEICKNINMSPSTYLSRLKKGATDEEIIIGKYKRICPICDKEFITDRFRQKYCCKTCSNRSAHGKGKYKEFNRICVVCGKEFKGNRSEAKTCSNKCNHAYCTATRKKRYKRLQQLGHYDYSITLEAVYEKFDGKCNLCSKQLSFESNPLSNEYPSIDHMIPLSKGGYHEWDNVQLLCRRCNFKKGNNPTWIVSNALK